MATGRTADEIVSAAIGTWHAGVGAGIAGVIPMMLFSAVVGGKELFPLFGLMPFAVLWGVVYAGIARVDRVARVATDPRTALPAGIVYGFLVWWGPQVGKPIGEYVTVNGAVQVVLFGAVLGLVYAYSPGLDSARGVPGG